MQFPNIDPVMINLGGILPIKWYAIAYILGYSIAIWFLHRQLRIIYSQNLYEKNKKNIQKMEDFSILFLIIFARLFYILFYDLEFYLKYPDEMYKIWHGGMSFHGGAFGILLSIFYFSIKYKMNFCLILDLISVVTPIGLFFGRIANFINGELWGRAANCKICMIFPDDILQIYRHPSQLYEAFFEGFILSILMYCLYNFFYLKYKIYQKYSGILTTITWGLYSIFRYFIEYYREPTAQNIVLFKIEFTRGQILCIIMLMIAILFYPLSYFFKKYIFNLKNKSLKLY